MPRKPRQRSQTSGGAAPYPDPLSESYRALVASFRPKLLAENKSSRTVQTYGEALRLFDEFLTDHGMPLVLAHIRRKHVEGSSRRAILRMRHSSLPGRRSCSTWSALGKEGERIPEDEMVVFEHVEVAVA